MLFTYLLPDIVRFNGWLLLLLCIFQPTARLLSLQAHWICCVYSTVGYCFVLISVTASFIQKFAITVGPVRTGKHFRMHAPSTQLFDRCWPPCCWNLRRHNIFFPFFHLMPAPEGFHLYAILLSFATSKPKKNTYLVQIKNEKRKNTKNFHRFYHINPTQFVYHYVTSSMEKTESGKRMNV